MKKIISIIALTMILCSCGGAAEPETTPESKIVGTEETVDSSQAEIMPEITATVTPEPEEKLWSYTRLLDSTGLSEGKVVSLIETDKGKYKVVTDEYGKLLFYFDTVEDSCSPREKFSNGYMSTVCDDIYYVLDENGNICSSYYWGEVAGHGAGYTWIEYFSGDSWDSEGYYYYTLYDPHGGEVTNISMEGKYDKDTMYEPPRADIWYLGEGVFCYYAGYDYPDVYTSFYFTSTREWKENIKTFSDYESLAFYNGSSVPLYVDDNMVDYGDHGEEERHAFTILDSDGEIQTVQIPNDCLSSVSEMFTDRWEPDILGHSEQYYLFYSRNLGYFVYNRETNEFKMYDGKYSEYMGTSIEDANICGNVFAMAFSGADNRKYVGLINADTMEEIGEPIAGDAFVIQDGALALDRDDTTYFYNLQGELIGEFPYDGVTLNYMREKTIVVQYDDGSACSIEHYDRTPLFETIDTKGALKIELS